MATSLLDTWMLTRPKIDDDMWYDKLDKSSEDGLLLENLSLVDDIYHRPMLFQRLKSTFLYEDFY